MKFAAVAYHHSMICLSWHLFIASESVYYLLAFCTVLVRDRKPKCENVVPGDYLFFTLCSQVHHEFCHVHSEWNVDSDWIRKFNHLLISWTFSSFFFMCHYNYLNARWWWQWMSSGKRFLQDVISFLFSNNWLLPMILQAPSAHPRFPNLNLTSGKTALSKA